MPLRPGVCLGPRPLCSCPSLSPAPALCSPTAHPFLRSRASRAAPPASGPPCPPALAALPAGLLAPTPVSLSLPHLRLAGPGAVLFPSESWSVSGLYPLSSSSSAHFSSRFPLFEAPVCLCPSVCLPVPHAHSSARDGTGTESRRALLELGGSPCPSGTGTVNRGSNTQAGAPGGPPPRGSPVLQEPTMPLLLQEKLWADTEQRECRLAITQLISAV